ncbi:hypothetical protein Droror1_Dr00026295 [Drosera rotundifolia]
MGSLASWDEFDQSVNVAVEEEEEERQWAKIERLPTYDRLRTGVVSCVGDDGRVVKSEVDLGNLGTSDKKKLVDMVNKFVDQGNDEFLRRLRDRIDRVGIEIPKIEVRYEHLSVEGNVYVGSRALPTLLNASKNALEATLGLVGLSPSRKRPIKILRDISGIVRPSRMTLLLGPPGAGKSTFLSALAGKLDKDLKETGKITYCGHDFKEFIPQRTCAYISPHDLHFGEMTVRETLDFSGRCSGVGTRYDLLAELSRREKEAGIKPDPEIDAFMKATAIEGQETNLLTDYIIKTLGLDICADIIIGDEMRRGISGGQKKRVTTGEMLVGPAKVLLMDDISTGLDSSTTYQICKYMRQLVHIMDFTVVISLLQPAPETYYLFDDLILLAEGHITYQGPLENVLDFFGFMGFKCPERKGVADFLQEATSRKDQQQYWFRKDEPYKYISVPEFVRGFQAFHLGQQLASDLSVPYDKSNVHSAALVEQKYGISNWELFKACFSREWLLMKRSSFMYIFKTTQITIISLFTLSVFFKTTMHHKSLRDGAKYHEVLFFSLVQIMFNGYAELFLTVSKLPIFYKQRDQLFYPAWAYALPIWVLRVPLSFVECAIWIALTYYTVGFAPGASRFLRQFLAYFSIHQMSLSTFRFIAAVGRSPVISNTIAFFFSVFVFVLGGFIIAKDDIKSWMMWGYYASPMMYGQNALVINEFLDERWSIPNTDPRIHQPTVGKALLASRGFYTEDYWYWICVGVLFSFSFIFNIAFALALTYLDPFGNSRAVVPYDSDEEKNKSSSSEGVEVVVKEASRNSGFCYDNRKRGMVLPFQRLSLAFNHINYYVDMPVEMRSQGVEGDRLQLLKDVCGAFRPGILTALVGVSGAGKTTLMDVLAGRKTGGYIEGSISISGYPKNQETFARISGYCEQTDIHSPNITVYESLLFSAWLRLSSDVDSKARKMFVEEVMDLVELKPLREALVGLPGVSGLSTEQRKRLTIAVELVANPSIIFMDEPTSGLDARAAAIVMRTVRNTVDTGRTVVCTIHQPSIDIFESFDELILMKRGGLVTYAGPLGRLSHHLMEYFEAIPGVPKIKYGYNPAAWMLEISSQQVESRLGVDFADLYANSVLYQRNQEIIRELSTPAPESNDLYFPTKHSQSFLTQCKACFWKQHWSYWRNISYNIPRFFMTIVAGLFFGIIFMNEGKHVIAEQNLMNFLGAMYCAICFLGGANATIIQVVVAIERTVFYRERAAGMYSAFPYAFAQVAIEIVYIVFQTVLYVILIFPMLGFEWKIVKFFYFYYFILMCFIYCNLYGMMVVSLTPVHLIATIVMSFVLCLWNLFGGFPVPKRQLPIWWRWYYWCTPTAWSLYGLVASQMGDLTTTIEIPGSDDMSIKAFVKSYFGYDHDFLPAVVIAHLGWTLLFIFFFAYGIKYLNFQRR